MSRLYLVRHGQTQFNLQHRVQGRCDSPLTERGLEQAHRAARWLSGHGVAPGAVYSSPLGRAFRTAEVLRDDLIADGFAVPLDIEAVEGLQERSYGPFEGGPASEVPADLWDPGETLVPYGGEGSCALRERIVGTLTELMRGSRAQTVLSVSHGSITLQFKLAWAHTARCPQDVPLGNCCILVFEFDERTGEFSNLEIANQEP